MTAAPEIPTQAAAAPVSSVALIMTSSTPASRNLGHQRVRRVRANGAALRRAGLPAETAGRPSGPGTGGTAALRWVLSRRRDHRVISATVGASSAVAVTLALGRASGWVTWGPVRLSPAIAGGGDGAEQPVEVGAVDPQEAGAHAVGGEAAVEDAAPDGFDADAGVGGGVLGGLPVP